MAKTLFSAGRDGSLTSVGMLAGVKSGLFLFFSSYARLNPRLSKEIQANSKENQGKPRKNWLGFPWISLDFFVRFRAFSMA